MPQRQAIRDDFESPPVQNVDPFQIHVVNKRVGPHSRPCFSAHLCRGLAPVKTLSPPRPPPHCTLHDNGQRSPIGGHIGRCARSRERAILRRRNRRSRKGCASILVIRLVGTAVKTADANGPCWDGIKAHSSVRELWPIHRVVERLVHASRGFVLPPKLGFAGFWGVGSNDGCAFLQYRAEEGTPNPASVKCSTHVLTAPKHGEWVPGHPLHRGRCHCGVALLHHGEAIGPTCPVSPLSQPCFRARSPRPPTDTSSDAVSLAASWKWHILKTWQRHSHTLASWRCANTYREVWHQ